MSATGPLGNLAGMFFDPITNRYYPNPRIGVPPQQANPGPSRPHNTSSSSMGGPSSSPPTNRRRLLPQKKDRRDKEARSAAATATDVEPTNSGNETHKYPMAICNPAWQNTSTSGHRISKSRGLRSRLMPEAGPSNLNRDNERYVDNELPA